jgi:iron complex outermembrane receptor protein
MIKRFALYILFLFSLFVSYSQTIEGYITDAENKPLQNVNVILSGVKKGTTTNENGFYSLSDINKGNYIIEVSHVGYTSHSQKIEINNDIVIKLDFTLQKEMINIEEVVIQAKSEDNFDIINIPVRTKLLDEQDIKQIPAISASKMFNSISGVNTSSEFGIFSTSTVVSLRGIGGNSQSGTLVVMDGMPLNKTDGGSVNWNIIDKDNIEKVEIIKGPGSALYGSNAMGGIINFISKPPDGNFGCNVSVSSGTYRTLEA